MKCEKLIVSSYFNKSLLRGSECYGLREDNEPFFILEKRGT